MAKGKLSFRLSDAPAYAGDTRWAGRPRPWKMFLLFLWSMAAAILTAAGFFCDTVPFALAYTPFLIALITRARRHRAALVGGHFTIVFWIAATGLVQLGFPVWAVGSGLILAIVSLSGLFAICGVGLAAVLLLLIPYFPGNPLLITGALYPGFGAFGFVLLGAACMAVARWKTTGARIAAVLITIVLPTLAVHSAQDDGFLNLPRLRGWSQAASLTTRQSDETGTTSPYESVALPRSRRSSETTLPENAPSETALIWHLLLALRDLPAGRLAITGENVMTSGDDSAKRLLCRMARAQALDLYVGVQASDGAGEIWRLSGQTCPDGARVYRAVTGIPGLTGPMWPMWPDVTEAGIAVNLPPALDSTGFLACFEAFTLHRWIAMGMRGFETVVVVSNDHWTDPLPVALLRTKVSDQFARLFGIEVVHAGRDRNILVLKEENPIAEEKTGE